ncbi:MAG: glycosyltransferase family 2 protein [Clostridia bacterium]|nr:glycosyltransferase family 2 protein [Clostridia bacterium]
MIKGISVVIPCYNAEKTLGRTVDSVLAQSYQDIEIILIDDVSRDGTLALAREYEAKDSRIRVIAKAENGGVARARNDGVKAARHDWIAFVDSDDYWTADKLEKQIAAVERDPSVGLVFTGSAFVSEEGKRFDYTLSVPERITYNELLSQNLISCSSVLVKKELMEHNPMPTDKDIHEDFAAWLSVLKECGFAVGINEPLLIYQISSKSKSGNKLYAVKMQWRTYRCAGVGFFKAVKHFVIYAYRSLKKYGGIYRS